MCQCRRPVVIVIARKGEDLKVRQSASLGNLTQLGMVNFEQREIDLENEKIINEVILKFSTVKISLYGNFHGIPLC